jgi:uncharacterized protein GlcG (DUF336 family)
MRKLLLPLLLTLPLSALAQTPAAPPPPPAPGPALADALLAARTAIDACHDRQQNVSVAVVDSAGVHKLLLASDGAHQRGVASSTAKALTALAFKLPTSTLAERAKLDVALGARLAADASYNSRAGGLPIVKDGVVIGAIGVGGARGSDNDEACARAGLERIGARTAALPPGAVPDLGADRLVQHLP